MSLFKGYPDLTGDTVSATNWRMNQRMKRSPPEQFDLDNGFSNVSVEKVKQLKCQVITANDEIPPLSFSLARCCGRTTAEFTLSIAALFT